MNEQTIIGLAGVLVVIIGALLAHIARDGQYRQKVDDLAKRVSKLDGINGHG